MVKIETSTRQPTLLKDGVAEMHDTQFMRAREKERVLHQWNIFLKYGCKWEHFTKPLYEHLINNCSFIAHYDIRGFYGTYFNEGDNTARFLTQFDRSKGCRSIEYGFAGWIRDGNDVCQSYYDINNAMVDIAAKYIPALTHAAKTRQRDADVLMAKALLAKHGIQLK